MIKQSFLKKQIAKSKKEGKTSYFLKKLIFMVADQALKDHYDNERSMKCFQSSLLIQMLLEKFQIKSILISGHVCVSQVCEKEQKYSWGGFLEGDHHFWLKTEFNEYIDLTLHYLHLHPQGKLEDQLAMPPLWWEDVITWPRVIKYLPNPIMGEYILIQKEQEDFEEFKKTATLCFDNILNTYSVQEVKFTPILHNLDSMQELYDMGEKWVVKSFIFEELKVQHPTWVQKREMELIEKAKYLNLHKK